MARKSVPVTDIEDANDGNEPIGVIIPLTSEPDDIRIAEPEIINGFESFNPVDTEPHTGSDSGSSGRTGKRRGRPPGSGTARKTSKGSRDLGGVEKILYSLHLMAASAIAPELEITEEESKSLATAINDVSAHYNNFIDPKLMAWIQLAFCMGGLYAPRVIAIRNRVAEEESKTAKPQPLPINRTTPTATNSTPKTPADLYGPGNFGAVSASLE